MKNKFARILSVIMIFCISFLFVGCMGLPPQDQGGDVSGIVFDMYGTKVLYRPDSYDYNIGSGGEVGKENDYYGKYAYIIIKKLFQSYGVTISEELTDSLGTTISDNDIPYFYDSIRYKMDTFGKVTQRLSFGEDTATPLEEGDQYIVVGADLNTNWKWAFDYDLSGINSAYNALLVTNDEYDVEQDGHIYNNYTNIAEFSDIHALKYNNPTFNEFYTTAFLGTTDEQDYANYSDFVKTLEYVVYSYALDLAPKTVTVTINDNATSENELYNVSIASYSSVDDALADIKNTFNKLGTYVGLIQRQINSISAWIKNNIIGADILDNDSFTTYSQVTEVVAEDGSISYSFAGGTTRNLGRNYSTAVDNIIENVCSFVTIGSEENGGGVTINNRFLASQVTEYAGNTFFISDDSNFPAPNTSTAETAIKPLEYQSVQFMFKQKERISDIWIAIKYDADLDGTEKGSYDLSKYIDIKVELNYYNKNVNKLFTIGSQTTRVYDGAYKNIFDPNTYNLPSDVEDHGTLFFSDFLTNCTDPSLAEVTNGKEYISVDQYNTEIGGGQLKTDVGENGYKGSPLVSKNPLVLLGTTDVRKYYSIIEPSIDEIAPGLTYTTGRANEQMYSGDDGCGYFEVTYKVLKKPGDTTTNYKFYTGVVALFDPYEP